MLNAHGVGERISMDWSPVGDQFPDILSPQPQMARMLIE